MSELGNLLSKKVKEVPFLGTTIRVRPLGVDLLEEVMALEDEHSDIKRKTEAIKNIAKSILSDNFPDMTDEEFGKIPLEELIKLIDAIKPENDAGIRKD